MKFLFVTHVPGQARHFVGVFRELVARGHSIKLLAANKYADRELRLPDFLVGIPDLSIEELVPRAENFWSPYLGAIRYTRNYLHYYHPRLLNAEPARRRALAWTDPFLRRFLPGRHAPSRGFLALLRMLEGVLPLHPGILALLERERPDAMVVTPLIFNETIEHVDYVKCAHRLGIPVAFPVFSWDNLSTKGTLHVCPDQVYVWNEVQMTEAVEMHGVPAERISVLGAWRFDEFAALSPSQDRAAFCAEHGLDPGRPLILYLGSSPFIAPEEPRFVAEWLQCLRKSEHRLLREASILMRAHPRCRTSWRQSTRDLDLDNVAFQDAGETTFMDARPLYDALHHCKAVVGANTSAMLEAAVVGRPVHSLRHPLLHRAQWEMVHFEYLNAGGKGLLHLAEDMSDHERRLAAALADPGDRPDERSVCFRQAFIDPPERDRPATAQLIECLERLACSAKRPQRPSPVTPVVRQLVRASILLRLMPLSIRTGPDRDAVEGPAG